jgi:hypothetical protein
MDLFQKSLELLQPETLCEGIRPSIPEKYRFDTFEP